MGASARQFRTGTGQLCADRGLLLGGGCLRGHVCGLGQGSGIVVAKHRAAKAYRSVDLRLPEQPVAVAGVSQRVEENLGAGFQILREFRVGAQRHFAQRQLASVVATSADKLDPSFNLVEITGVDRRVGGYLLRRPRAKQAANAARRRIDFGFEQV